MTNADIDSISWMRVMLAFAAVFSLLALFALALKYVKARGFAMPGMAAHARRLEIIEVLPLDPRRRLVIVRRDEAEHLLLLGGAQDLLVEADCGKDPQGIQTKSGT